MKVQGRGILVMPDEAPEKSPGGLVINPIEAKLPDSGVALQCGPGCEITKDGDHIQYKRKGASIIHIEGVEHHFIIEEQIYFNHGQ